MERYDIRVNVWGDVYGPQYEWETVKAEDGDFVLYADAQATVEALQRERDELREMTTVLCGHCCEPMAIPSKAALQTHLSALQGLVRALVCTRTYMVDGEYIRTRGGSILYICSNSISAERLGALLAYRATLPATPTERGENHSGDDTDMVQKGGGDGE